MFVTVMQNESDVISCQKTTNARYHTISDSRRVNCKKKHAYVEKHNAEIILMEAKSYIFCFSHIAKQKTE